MWENEARHTENTIPYQIRSCECCMPQRRDTVHPRDYIAYSTYTCDRLNYAYPDPCALHYDVQARRKRMRAYDAKFVQPGYIERVHRLSTSPGRASRKMGSDEVKKVVCSLYRVVACRFRHSSTRCTSVYVQSNVSELEESDVDELCCSGLSSDSSHQV